MKLFIKYFLLLLTFVTTTQANIPPLKSSYNIISYDYGARYYDPRTSVWQSPDPIIAEYMSGKPNGGVFSAQNLHLYTYAHNSPIIYKDPDGKWIKQLADFSMNVAIGYASEGKLTWSVVKGAAIETVKDAANPMATVNKAKKIAKIVKSFRQKQQKNVNNPGLVSKKVSPNTAQQKNINRFQKKVPANAKENVQTRELPGGGIAAQATSPGNVRGSKAVYEKQIDIGGKTMQYTKTTYDPSGNIVHVKDKIKGGVFK